MPARKRKAAFVEPMLLLRADNLPEGDAWQYELKFDGYRALAINTGGKIPHKQVMESMRLFAEQVMPYVD